MPNIKEKLAEYREAVFGNAIYDLIKFLMISLGGSCFITTVSNVVIDLVNQEIVIKYRIPITILCICTTIIIILEMYTKNFRHHPNTPTVEADYVVVKREIFFTYGRDESKYELILNVKSNINNLNRIHGKYTWSGSDEALLHCETKHCRLIPLIRKDSFIEYEVELRKNYKKGKHAECKIVGNMPDSKHQFIPFFSTQITEETKELIINICIPPEYGVREIIREEIAIVRNANENSEVILLDAQGKYTWTIKNPKLFYKYSIRWDL